MNRETLQAARRERWPASFYAAWISCWPGISTSVPAVRRQYGSDRGHVRRYSFRPVPPAPRGGEESPILTTSFGWTIRPWKYKHFPPQWAALSLFLSSGSINRQAAGSEPGTELAWESMTEPTNGEQPRGIPPTASSSPRPIRASCRFAPHAGTYSRPRRLHSVSVMYHATWPPRPLVHPRPAAMRAAICPC